jgi:hypothetical protein
MGSFSNLANYFPNNNTNIQTYSNSFIIKNNTSDIYNQIGSPLPLEIKNNNFEINNNFYGSINIESSPEKRNSKA